MTFMQKAITVQDQSQIGEARRYATALAENAGFSESDRGRVALVVTELATNLVKYAKEGQILLRVLSTAIAGSIEVMSIDRGPGIDNFQRCLADGYSTGGTAGTGLGAVQRLCSTFDFFTSKPAGTLIYCLVDAEQPQKVGPASFLCGVVNLPAPHETVCGDTWRIVEKDQQLAAIIIDGLGHGPDAAQAANEAADAFEQASFCRPSTMLESLHIRLRTTRGAAVATCLIDARTHTMTFAGVGNIAGSIKAVDHSPSRGLFSHNGIVGAQLHKIQEFEYPFPTGSLLVLQSDGLQTRWSLEKYPGLAQRHPGVIAGILYRDFCRGRDDVTVAAIRLKP